MTCDVTTTLGYPATINTPEYADVIADAGRYHGLHAGGGIRFPGRGGLRLLPDGKARRILPCGYGRSDRPITSSPHHNCNFQLDERGLAIALEMELALYLKLTKQDGE